MSASDAKSQPVLGFLTVLEDQSLGLTGGYLLLNRAGRPLEFHCTAPVRPNRAQQILFGPTLLPYLCGEQIGQALLAKSSLAPLVVCTDAPATLCLRDFVELPVALVMAEQPPGAAEGEAPSGVVRRVDAPHGAAAPLSHFECGGNRLAVAAGRERDQQMVVERLGTVGPFDLAEPFARIREAISEAHRAGRN